MTTWDLLIQWSLLLGGFGAIMCVGLWICEWLDRRDEW